MEWVEILRAIIEAAEVLFSSPKFLNALKIIAAIAATALLCMKAYKFGRDKILKKIKLFMLSDEGFWDSAPKRNLARHASDLRSGCPVLTVVNFKGGVGKTTIAANIAAHFDSVGARVLLIDFDYQGSLTDYVIFKHKGNLKLGAATVLDVSKTATDVVRSIETPVSHFQQTGVLASAYSLNRTENRMAFRWMAGESKRDVRYALKDFLASKVMKGRYDIIIIDAPPRIMTATVNAICASTHVIVPTILDGLSASATANTVEAILKLRDRLSPTLEIIGVVPTMVEQATAYRPREKRALYDLQQDLAAVRDRQAAPIEIFESERILRRAAIASLAHEDIAYFCDPSVKEMFDNLGQRIAKRIKLDLGTTDESPRAKAYPEASSGNLVSIAR